MKEIIQIEGGMQMDVECRVYKFRHMILITTSANSSTLKVILMPLCDLACNLKYATTEQPAVSLAYALFLTLQIVLYGFWLPSGSIV